MEMYEKDVIKFFKSIDMNAAKILECDQKTPDFLLEDHETTLVELKVKLDTKESLTEKESVFADGNVFEHAEHIAYTGKIANVVKSANKQLKAQKRATKSKFCFLFFIADGVSPSSQLKQLEMTLYGAKAVCQKGVVQAKYCYYFGESQFFRYRDILDGVFMGNAAKGTVALFLNNLSVNYNDLLNSAFLEAFQQRVPVIDPTELERNGNIYMITDSVDRRDSQLVLQHLFSKYQIENGSIHEFVNNSFSAQL
ncbi:hypothetical protein ACA895_004056 [Vibrio vulnificus]|nr:hypothetical protein [Vibrio vulnificus]